MKVKCIMYFKLQSSTAYIYIQLSCKRFYLMSHQKYVIFIENDCCNQQSQVLLEPFQSTLPDFLLKFIDLIIKEDICEVLRYDYLHYPLQDLVHVQMEPQKQVWTFIDPKGEKHLYSSEPYDAEGLKRTKSKPNQERVLSKMTEVQFKGLNFSVCKNFLSNKIQPALITEFRQFQIITLDQIRLECEGNYYMNAETLIQDLKQLITWNQVFRATSLKTFQYLSVLYDKIILLIAKKDLTKKFNEIKSQDFLKLFKYEVRYKTQVKKWPFIPTDFRQYQQISEYVPSPENRKEIIQKRLNSEKVPIECPENCACINYEEGKNDVFCKFSLINGWETTCQNRTKKVECNHLDPLLMKKCRNSEIKKHLRKQCKKVEEKESEENAEIEECLSWGIDLYTRNNIYNSLPEIDRQGLMKVDNSEAKHEFIERKFLKAINFISGDGYSIEEACIFIKKNSFGTEIKEEMMMEKEGESQIKTNLHSKCAVCAENQTCKQHLFSAKDGFYADHLLKNVQFCSQFQCLKDGFRIHTKGKGARCIDKKGINQGRFIVEYFGELYEPWRWYDREDFIKEILKKRRLKNLIPEFYNIYLEKHADEPLGYDILVVDPSRKGNFSSRFSHSCNPNCGTIITVSDGKYYIGMYSIRDIEYGEELTFDYCSMTESNYEHLNSICLCGMKKCRGNYLQFSNLKIFNNLMDNKNCFYQRNSSILKSAGEVTPQEFKICSDWNIKAGFLSHCSDWIVKWMAQVLTFIEEEGQIYKNTLTQQWKKVYPWDNKEPEEQKLTKIQLYSETSKQDLISIRFQNLITSVDKLQFFYSKNNQKIPPVFIESNLKICQVLIFNENSILKEAQQCLIKFKCESQASIIEQFLNTINAITDEGDQLILFRLCCLIISHRVLFLDKTKSFNYQLFSDVLYIYAFTHTYFSCAQYKPFDADQIVVYLSQITGERNHADKKEKSKKKYANHFAWGQLVSWYKQTIVCPEASLSQDRRGTLSMPLMTSILRSDYPYEKNRNAFLKILKEKPANSWPPAKGCQLSFKNPFKLYGSMMFESVHSKQKLKDYLPKANLLESCLALINENLGEKLRLFQKVQNILEDHSFEHQAYRMLDALNVDLGVNLPLELRQQDSGEGEPRKRVKKEDSS